MAVSVLQRFQGDQQEKHLAQTIGILRKTVKSLGQVHKVRTRLLTGCVPVALHSRRPDAETPF